MAEERKPDTGRGSMAFIFAIILGLGLGLMVKNIRIGILIGLVLGILILFTGWVRISKK